MTENEMERDKRNFLKWLNSPDETRTEREHAEMATHKDLPERWLNSKPPTAMDRFRSSEQEKERSLERTRQKFEKALPSKGNDNEPGLFWWVVMGWLAVFASIFVAVVKWMQK